MDAILIVYTFHFSCVLHGTWVCSFAWGELRHGRKTESMEGFWCKCKFLGCQICFATLIDLVAGVLCLTLCCTGPKHSSCHLKKPKESYLISICGCEWRTSCPNVVQSH